MRCSSPVIQRLIFTCVAAVFALGLSATSASAQRRDTPGEFDFYVLALSWSSGFCETSGDRQGKRQCDIGTGHGFVVHGLWPQFERGYPSSCGSFNRSVPSASMAIARQVFTDDGLARHEWNKHGTCSGLDPSSYFRATAVARQKLKIPERFAAPKEEFRLDPQEIERAFQAANPGLRPEMMAISCKRGVLTEIRVCMTKDLRDFQTCREVDRQGCRTRDVSVPPVR
jgi:ribonuclease T2